MGRASNRKKANRRSGHTRQARRAMRLTVLGSTTKFWPSALLNRMKADPWGVLGGHEGARGGIWIQCAGDDRWPLEVRYPGPMLVDLDDGEGRPNQWVTLRALRVLRWHAQG